MTLQGMGTKPDDLGGSAANLTRYERVASGGSKGNQTKWYRDGIWYKADFLGYEGLAECICSKLLKASNVRSYVQYAPVYITETDSGREFLGCMSRDFGTFASGDVILLHLPEKYNVWLNPTGSPATDLSVFCQGVKQVFGADIIEDMKVMMQFDMIVGNEDRILRNFGLKQVGSGYEFAPLFDHGLSLLSDNTSPNRAESIDEIIYHPFSCEREKGNGLNELGIIPIVIDTQQFFCEMVSVPVYPKEAADAALRILRRSLDETEGKLWTKPKQ